MDPLAIFSGWMKCSRAMAFRMAIARLQYCVGPFHLMILQVVYEKVVSSYSHLVNSS